MILAKVQLSMHINQIRAYGPDFSSSGGYHLIQSVACCEFHYSQKLGVIVLALIVLIRGFLRNANLGEWERVCMLYSVLQVR